MQSLTSKIFMATLRMIFHSPLSDSSKLSDNAAKLTKDKKSRYKPSKNFTYTKHFVEEIKYEKIINKNCNTEKVILMIHGGGFKIELNDFYRKLAEKYSNMFCGATVINVDYGRFPEHQLPSQMHDVVKIYLNLLD
ncbi:MAG: alpha/beta hydrolase fold domain-containing protein, partial [Oscillospiraceae bacterium]|nr:alpha/beta hydrolase fold domain-containing protein [Oscillospiraceae bacterium]